MDLEDFKKTLETTVGALTPDRARQLAKGMMEPGAAKDQVAKAAAELLEWSARGRDRVIEVTRREVREQLHGMGLATQQEVEALRKRVRELERAAGSTKRASSGSTKGAGSKRTTAKRAPAKRSTSAGTSGARGSTSGTRGTRAGGSS